MCKFSVILICSFLFLSCSTIHYRFDNEPDGTGNKEWHHIGAFQLVEFSDDVRIRKHCPNGAHEITSKRNAFQSLVSMVPWLGWAWSPTEVSVECGEKSAMNINKKSSGAKTSSQSDSENANTNTNTININISPEMMKKRKNKKK